MNYHWPDLIDHVNYTVVGGDGTGHKNVAIPVDDMPMMHDMSLTDTYAVVYDLSVTVNLDVLGCGLPVPVQVGPRPARVGSGSSRVMDPADDVIWCDVDPCYVFHPLNAYDGADGTVVVDVCRYDAMMVDDRLRPVRRPPADVRPLDHRPDRPPGHRDPHSTIGRRSSPVTTRRSASSGIATATRRRSGRSADTTNIHGAIIKIDTDTGSTEAHEFGRGRGGAEPVFVPKADGTAEDAGWILTVVYDATTDTSELHILDAEDFAGPEVATIALPQRVPFGFHGNWVPDTSVAPD